QNWIEACVSAYRRLVFPKAFAAFRFLRRLHLTRCDAPDRPYIHRHNSVGRRIEADVEFAAFRFRRRTRGRLENLITWHARCAWIGPAETRNWPTRTRLQHNTHRNSFPGGLEGVNQDRILL